MSDRYLLGGAKAASYTILFIAAALTLFRGVVGPLWGSRSDYGLFGAVIAGSAGLIGLAWLAGILIRDVQKHFTKEPDQ